MNPQSYPHQPQYGAPPAPGGPPRYPQNVAPMPGPPRPMGGVPVQNGPAPQFMPQERSAGNAGHPNFSQPMMGLPHAGGAPPQVSLSGGMPPKPFPQQQPAAPLAPVSHNQLANQMAGMQINNVPPGSTGGFPPRPMTGMKQAPPAFNPTSHMPPAQMNSSGPPHAPVSHSVMNGPPPSQNTIQPPYSMNGSVSKPPPLTNTTPSPMAQVPRMGFPAGFPHQQSVVPPQPPSSNVTGNNAYVNGPRMAPPAQGYPPVSGAYQQNDTVNMATMAGGGYPPTSQYQYAQQMSYPGGDARNSMMPPPMQPPQMQQQQPMFPAQQPSFQPPSQPQQQRRLDPEQMPSPIQVMQDDQKSRSGDFVTNQKGHMPPLVTTKFVTKDNGIVGPRFMRSTMYSVPNTPEMMKQTAVPFGLVISPLAVAGDGEIEPPVVDLGETGPVRCIRCKAYMCPFMQFIDGGRRFQCVFCKATAEVPPEYFQHLDHTGQRMDKYERPELCLGTYEFVATKDYCRNNTTPKPPAFIFIMDVSYTNLKSGMVSLLCSKMKEILQLLPREHGTEKSAIRVGFITYSNVVHFYNVKSCLSQPQMMVVSDVNDVFMPLLDGFLCDPEESATVIDSLMEQIPRMFAGTHETEIVLGSAIQAGLEALKASDCTGKLFIFHSSLPTAEAPGKLKNRDDRKVLGTDKEKTVLAPQTNFYSTLGQECVGSGCTMDLFIFNNSYIDLATIGQVARLTGGQLYKYTYFQADLDGERFIEDLKHDVGKPLALDAIMRVRTSTGVRPTDFYGCFFMSNTTDMEMGGLDCDHSVAVEVKHDDKLTEEDGVYVQVALLYTSVAGQRRLRVLNLALNTCVQMADLFRNCELDAIINFFSKQAMVKLLEQNPQTVKEGLINRCAQMLACYRKHCASPSSAGQLILPECLKLLPLYINCLLKSDAVSGGADMATDDRSFIMQAVLSMDVMSSVGFFYSRLLPLHDIDEGSMEIPTPIRCSVEKLKDDGVYLLENGIYMFLWIGLNVGMNWVQDVFGVHSAAQIDIDRTSLHELDNPLSTAVRNIIDKVRRQRQRFMRLTLVRQRDKMEFVFRHFLVEDRGSDTSPSYVDFLCHMHKEIRNLLS